VVRRVALAQHVAVARRVAEVRQPRSAGVRRSPWHTKICQPLRSVHNAPGHWSEPCADRARQPAPLGWQRAESRPGRRYRKRGSG
jgi:hypothetical protein